MHTVGDFYSVLCCTMSSCPIMTKTNCSATWGGGVGGGKIQTNRQIKFIVIICPMLKFFSLTFFGHLESVRPFTPEKRPNSLQQSRGMERLIKISINNLRKQPNSQQRPKDMLPRVVVVQRFHCISHHHYHKYSLHNLFIFLLFYCIC